MRKRHAKRLAACGWLIALLHRKRRKKGKRSRKVLSSVSRAIRTDRGRAGSAQERLRLGAVHPSLAPRDDLEPNPQELEIRAKCSARRDSKISTFETNNTEFFRLLQYRSLVLGKPWQVARVQSRAVFLNNQERRLRQHGAMQD